MNKHVEFRVVTNLDVPAATFGTLREAREAARTLASQDGVEKVQILKATSSVEVLNTYSVAQQTTVVRALIANKAD